MVARLPMALFCVVQAWCAVFGAPSAVAQRSDDGARITGTVKDVGGNPLQGVTVALGPVPTLFDRERGTYARTDAQGKFSVEVVYPGNITVSYWHPEYMPQTLTGSTEVSQEIVLRRGTTLAGSAQLSEEFLGKAVVSAHFPASGFLEYVRVSREGRFQFSNLPVGRCELELRAENTTGARRWTASVSAVLLPDRTNRTAIGLPQTGASLAGTLRDAAGGAITGQVALHVNAGSAAYYEVVRIGSEGRYNFSALPEGAGSVVISPAGRASQLLPVTVSGEAELDAGELVAGKPLRCSFLAVPAGTRGIHLSVLFGKTSRPTGGLPEIRALLDAPAAWSGMLQDTSAEVGNLLPGDYTLLAYPVFSEGAEHAIFETAELLRVVPVYFGTVTINETGPGAMVAATFPRDQGAAHAAAQQTLHPISVITDDKRRMHTIRPDGKLDVEGTFIATKL